MNHTTTPTGYVPVTADTMSASRSAALAETLSAKRYNWDSLAEFLGDYTTPEDVAESLKLVYFEFSRLLILNPADAPSEANNLLFQLQTMHDVFRRMGNDEPGCFSLVLSSESDCKH